MKVGYILALAWYLRRRDNVRRLSGLLGPFVLTVLPMLLVLMQPDLGTALLLMPVLFVMLFAAGARLRHLLTVILLGAVSLPLFWNRMHDYQRFRVAGVLLQIEAIRTSISENPDSPWAWLCTADAAKRWEQGDGFQLIGSKTALGSGGLLGHGWKEGTYVKFEFLPARHTDFIFAIIGEQFGFVGCLGVLGCYLLIILAGVEIAVATSEPFGKLLAVGVVSMIFTQAAINVGMTMGLAPVTGIPLPFMSYGGSSMMVSYLLIALLISVSQHRPFSVAPRPFESAAAYFGAG
jgi:cell division protein FtsW (lipid II flippase)